MKGSLVAEDTPSPEETEVPEPEAPINADVDEIAAQADKPDAVSKAIKAEREAAKEARRRAEEAEAKVKEYEDAQKTEQQKLEEAAAAAKEEADALRKQITDLEVKQRRSDVAAAKNLPPKLAGRLTGETVEEIEADADALLEDLGTLPGETPPPGDGGARTPVQPKDLDDQIREAEAAGDYRKSISLKNQKLLARKA
jgi:DNA repair exonuclease SbcCD ATPase subunit